VRGVRLLVKTTMDCYTTLGVIHTNWHPIPGEFDDYISAPKGNNYRSLHTAVVYDDGKTVEFQIRTFDMHSEAEQGIAAHWRYKEGSEPDAKLDEMIKNLRALMEWRQEVEDAHEFVDGVKTDVLPEQVYVFTPKGDPIDLPSGSTPIDFAYHIHTDIGHRCRGARVNGKLVSLDYELQTGDKVEILPTKRGGPSRDWLNPELSLVKTQRAKSKIRHWFKEQAREQNIASGKNILERELRRMGMTATNLDELAHKLGYPNSDELHFSLGCGDLTTGKIVNLLSLGEQQEKEEAEIDTSMYASEMEVTPTDAVTIVGLKGMLTNLAKCCKPAPGDAIVGFITRGHGVTIHRNDCPNILNTQDRDRLIQVSWGAVQSTFPVPVRIKAFDRKGLMRDISTIIDSEGINLNSVGVKIKDNIAVFDMVLEIHAVSELRRVLNRIANITNVFEAQRLRPG
jgi:GTP pyrophosphokinase